jgi:hypothetical protein
VSHVSRELCVTRVARMDAGAGFLGAGCQDVGMRYTAKQLGWVTMASAVLAVIVSLISAPTGIALGVITLVLGALALRLAVRTDAGVAQALFGLAFGFIALVTAVFLYGGQRGGHYTGEQRSPVATVHFAR